MSKRQDQIIAWLKEAKSKKISTAYVAHTVGLTAQNLNYHLHESPELDLDIYNDVKKVLAGFIDTENIQPTYSSLLNKDKTKIEALQSELKEAKELLQKILERFFFLEHFYDERYSTFYLKSRVTDPVDYETSDVLTNIENFLNLEELREDARRSEIAINKMESDKLVKKSLRIIMDNDNNNSKNDDEN